MADDTDPLARLRGIDPASSAPAPNLEAIRGRAQDRSRVVPMRARRRGIAVGVAAAGVAVVAGVGLAGVALGRASVPEPDIVAAVAPDEIPVVGEASPPIPVVAGQPGAGMAAETGAAAATDKAMAIYPGYGAAIIPGPDLADEPGTARGFRLDGSDVDVEALARQLAVTFDVDGSPTRQDYGWSVGSTDGTGPSIWIGDDATVSWSFSDPRQDPWSCGVEPEPAPEPMPADGSSDGSGVADVAQPCDPEVQPIEQRDALREARKILASLGVTEASVEGVDLEWETGGDDYTTWVTAWQRIDGQRTQLSWSFTFAGEDVAWANGFAAGLEQVPSYPIVGARTAVTRSTDPRFSSFGPTPLDFGIAVPMAEARDDAVSSTDVTASPSAAPAGDPRRVQVWWDPMTAVSAELSLAQYWQPDGTLLILPAYRVTTADDRGTWAIIAVAETAVDFVEPTE